MSLKRGKAMKRSKPLSRAKPGKHAAVVQSLKREVTLSRKAIKQRKGRIGKLRQDCNRYARERYLADHTDATGKAPGQCCGNPLPKKGFEAHHKVAVGEKLENKAAVHKSCHNDFIHDRQHPEHRRAMEHWSGNVVTGGVINWDTYGQGEAFRAFMAGQPQPKGIRIPVGIHKGKHCQGCRLTEALGTKLYEPCILHVGAIPEYAKPQSAHDGLFAPPSTEKA